MALELKTASSPLWLEAVMGDFETFLLDHATCEKKASGMALSIISHYPDKPVLIREMLNLAVEELSHYRDVLRLVLERGLKPVPDTRDDYVNNLQKLMDRGRKFYLMDRLLVSAIVEARGAERFGLIAGALPPGQLKHFYLGITSSESRHWQLFIDLAEQHCDPAQIPDRLETLLQQEAEILAALPIRAALH
jgi:tRNA-(ms[2]io[6]A)-hydroxylase